MLSLSELNNYIRQVLALNFDRSIKVRAEINQVNESRGHYYLDLIEKSGRDDQIIARQSAAIWRSTAQLLEKKHGNLFAEILQRGNELSLSCKVDFHSKYGLKLIIQDIDPAFTMGQLELERQATLAYVRQEGLTGLNARLPLPALLYRIAVISSREAAGWADFYRHLCENESISRFQIHLFHSSVQGKEAASGIISHLQEIERKGWKYDCILLMRGGGSKLDLAAFDNRQLAVAISRANTPIICAVGHETDQSVADLMAHSSVKTPTAAAEWLLAHNAALQNALADFEGNIGRVASKTLASSRRELSILGERINWTVAQRIREHRNTLESCRSSIQRESRRHHSSFRTELSAISDNLRALDPMENLRKGYALVANRQGNILRSVKQVSVGQELHVRISDGRLSSEVKKVFDERQTDL